MSFGFSISDFVTVPTFAWKVYKGCKDASDDFRSLSSAVGALHLVLKETQELLSAHHLSVDQQTRLCEIGKGCRDELTNLETILDRYNSLGTRTQRTWDRMGWGLQQSADLRDRLVASTSALTAFNSALTTLHGSSSVIAIEKKLNQLLAEVRAGQREGSAISTSTLATLSTNDEETWRQLGRELEDVGLSSSMLAQHRDFIINWFRQAVESGRFDETGSELSAVIPSQERESLSNASPVATLTAHGQTLGKEHVSSNQRRPKTTNTSRSSIPYLVFRLLRSGSQFSTATRGDAKKVNKILDFDVDIDGMDGSGRTMLHHAVENGQDEMVLLLLERGANVNAECRDGSRALHHAVRVGHDRIAQILVERGANVNAECQDGSRALHHAARMGHERIAQVLLEKGAKIEARTKDQMTALLEAVCHEHERTAQILVEKGANVNAECRDGSRALHHAARVGHERIAQILVERGANVNAKCRDGSRALHHAARMGHERIARILLEKGAKIEARTEDQITALHEAACRGHERIAQILLEKGAEIEVKDLWNRRPLHLAASHGHEAVVQLLLEKGSNFEARGTNKETPVHCAAQGGHKAVVQLLLEKGSNFEVRDGYDHTPVHRAALGGHEAALRLLLEKGANVNACTEDGLAAIHFAAGAGHVHALRVLLDKGARKDLKVLVGVRSLTAFDLTKYSKVRELLQNYEA